MSTSFTKKFNSIFIPQWKKDLTIGYTKDAQHLIKYTQIPMAISYLCLIYYHETDYFDINTSILGKDTIHINDKKNKVTSKKPGSYIVHGIMDITSYPGSFIYSWTFALDTSRSQYAFLAGLGLVDSADIENYYTLFSTGNSYTRSKDNECGIKIRFKPGDIVKMQVNIKQKAMRFFKNGKDEGIVFDNIDFETSKYKMFVSMAYEGQSAEMLQFSTDIDPCTRNIELK